MTGLPLGLAACTPAAAALSCTATPSAAAPLQNTVESVTVKSAAGAKVLATVNFASGAQHLASVTNAHGGSQLTFPVGAAKAGSAVNVVIKVVKGAQQATCSTSFNPQARTVTAAKPKLTGTIGTRWMGVTIGDSWDGWAGVCYGGPHIRTGGGCGTVGVPITVRGFDAYGGIATCPAGQQFCDRYEGPELSGTIELQWQLRCNATGVVTSRNQVVELGGAWGSASTRVNSLTRQDSDVANLEIAADMPFNADIQYCTNATLLGLSATDVKLHLAAGSGFPASDFAAKGPFAGPIA